MPVEENSEVVRRVAQAIAAAGDEGIWGKSWLYRAARAAIAAMRNPTPAMLDAGCAAHPVLPYDRNTLLADIVAAEHRAMIDKALE